MIPTIRIIHEKRLIGKRFVMSISEYRVGELWQSFMPERKNIQNKLSDDLLSVSVYPSGYFTAFNPANEFDKWAAVEVSDISTLPDGMEKMVIPEGLYAVFQYKGLNTDRSVFQYIYGSWLPASDFILDDRPHFEVLGAKYRNNAPESEEEIWIPVRKK